MKSSISFTVFGFTLLFTACQTMNTIQRYPQLGATMECSESVCKQDVKAPICCGENFGCLENDSKDLCVYKFTQMRRPDADFCRSQYGVCYYCCFNNQCNNSKACINHYDDYRQNALLIFTFTLCLFMIAIITFTVFVAIRQIRLNKVNELKTKHRILSNYTITQFKDEDSSDIIGRDERSRSSTRNGNDMRLIDNVDR